MRLFPPVYGFSRLAIEDTSLHDFEVPKGTQVLINTAYTHRDPRWWENPDAFIPERFAADNDDNLPKYAYLPFGGGPRICIGNSFAMMEARLILATIAQRFHLRLPAERTEVDPEP
ncbi:MAG: cytochrome P450 [Blastochloris sp.]|nr:cytochrome P450 [Blastochloris sp.]